MSCMNTRLSVEAMHAAAGSETHGLPAELHCIDRGVYMKPRMNVVGFDRAMFDVHLGHHWYCYTFCRCVLDRLGTTCLSRAKQVLAKYPALKYRV